MRYLFKLLAALLLTLCLSGINSASASDIHPMAYPLEVELTTSSPTYMLNEVVNWKVNIAGGSTTGPYFDVHFSDSRGNSQWIRGLNKYTTTISLDYEKAGSITGYVSVYGGGQTKSASKTIKVQ